MNQTKATALAEDAQTEPSETFMSLARSEQFYCFLYGHALLSSAESRQLFSRMLTARLGYEVQEPSEVYVEPAPLRDHWSMLGQKQFALAEALKHETVRSILEHAGLNVTDLNSIPFLWKQSKSRGRRLISPAGWAYSALYTDLWKPLLAVRQAYNARPDMMVVTPNAIFFVEAKLESPPPALTPSTYDQFGIQLTISALAKHLIGSFGGKQIHNLLITPPSPRWTKWASLSLTSPFVSVSWPELIGGGVADLDHFTVAGLARLKHWK